MLCDLSAVVLCVGVLESVRMKSVFSFHILGEFDEISIQFLMQAVGEVNELEIVASTEIRGR